MDTKNLSKEDREFKEQWEYVAEEIGKIQEEYIKDLAPTLDKYGSGVAKKVAKIAGYVGAIASITLLICSTANIAIPSALLINAAASAGIIGGGVRAIDKAKDAKKKHDRGDTKGMWKDIGSAAVNAISGVLQGTRITKAPQVIQKIGALARPFWGVSTGSVRSALKGSSAYKKFKAGDKKGGYLDLGLAIISVATAAMSAHNLDKAIDSAESDAAEFERLKTANAKGFTDPNSGINRVGGNYGLPSHGNAIKPLDDETIKYVAAQVGSLPEEYQGGGEMTDDQGNKIIAAKFGSKEVVLSNEELVAEEKIETVVKNLESETEWEEVPEADTQLPPLEDTPYETSIGTTIQPHTEDFIPLEEPEEGTALSEIDTDGYKDADHIEQWHTDTVGYSYLKAQTPEVQQIVSEMKERGLIPVTAVHYGDWSADGEYTEVQDQYGNLWKLEDGKTVYSGWNEFAQIQNSPYASSNVEEFLNDSEEAPEESLFDQGYRGLTDPRYGANGPGPILDEGPEDIEAKMANEEANEIDPEAAIENAAEDASASDTEILNDLENTGTTIALEDLKDMGPLGNFGLQEGQVYDIDEAELDAKIASIYGEPLPLEVTTNIGNTNFNAQILKKMEELGMTFDDPVKILPINIDGISTGSQLSLQYGSNSSNYWTFINKEDAPETTREDFNKVQELHKFVQKCLGEKKSILTQSGVKIAAGNPFWGNSLAGNEAQVLTSLMNKMSIPHCEIN